MSADLGCSYCGEDITPGQHYHWHRYREGRHIHHTCLDVHLENKSEQEVDRIMLQYWGDEEIA